MEPRVQQAHEVHAVYLLEVVGMLGSHLGGGIEAVVPAGSRWRDADLYGWQADRGRQRHQRTQTHLCPNHTAKILDD